MEKKMYNHPATEITEIESLHVIMDGTASGPSQDPINSGTQGSGESADAPQRYPRF